MKVVERGKVVQMAMARAVQDCFAWIPEFDYAGLERVELFDSISDLEFEPTWSGKNCGTEDLWVKAIYFPGKGSKAAFVTLFIESANLPLDRFIRFRPITTLYFIHILAHEVGHHLIATRGYIFTSDETYRSAAFEEEMADRYAYTICQRLMDKWYYRASARILRFISKIHFEEGRQNWKKGDYSAAATCWYKAWLLDFDNFQAGELYLEAKRKSASCHR